MISPREVATSSSAKWTAKAHLQGLQGLQVPETHLQGPGSCLVPAGCTKAEAEEGQRVEQVTTAGMATSAGQHWSMSPFSSIFLHRKLLDCFGECSVCHHAVSQEEWCPVSCPRLA